MTRLFFTLFLLCAVMGFGAGAAFCLLGAAGSLLGWLVQGPRSRWW